MKLNRDQTEGTSTLRRRSLLGGALAAVVAALLPRRRPKVRAPNPRSSKRSRWIGHY